MNVFEAVKDNAATRQAAEMYGIRVNRYGMAVCPFRNDKNPSMKVDKRLHCFACQVFLGTGTECRPAKSQAGRHSVFLFAAAGREHGRRRAQISPPRGANTVAAGRGYSRGERPDVRSAPASLSRTKRAGFAQKIPGDYSIYYREITQ